jgi:hypothetical protein
MVSFLRAFPPKLCTLFVLSHACYMPRPPYFPWNLSLALTEVADSWDSLQIWRVAANVLNKKSRSAVRGWPSSLGLDVGLTTPTVKNDTCYEICTWA